MKKFIDQHPENSNFQREIDIDNTLEDTKDKVEDTINMYIHSLK
ncbi:hypothetical protein ACFLY2_00165 [Patescibacteria group bacterium]